MSVDSKMREIKDCLGELIAELVKPSTSVGARIHHAHHGYTQIDALLYDISAKVHGQKGDKD